MKLLVWACLLVLVLLLCSHPRLLLASRDTGPWSLVSFLATLGWYVGKLMPG